jgi:hypothetical protein
MDLTPDPTTKKLAGIPDPSIFSELLQAIKSVRLRIRSPTEAEANIVLGYDPASGAFVGAQFYNPSTGAAEAARTPTVLKKSAVITSGTTALWTPAAGKRIRWMGVSITVDPATTTAAGSIVTIADGATAIDDLIALGINAPGIPFRASSVIGGNGILFPVGDVLNVVCSAALTAGGIYVNVWGCEE